MILSQVIPLIPEVASKVTSSLTIESVAVGFATMVLIAFWRDMKAFRHESSRFHVRIETALFGAQGDNGIAGTVKDHESRLRSLEHHP